MKKSRFIFFLLFTFIVISLSSCSKNINKTFIVDEYNISFTASDNWKIRTEKNPYDLQLFDGYSYMSIFAYHLIDLSDIETPHQIFQSQIEDLLSQRSNVEIVKNETNRSINEKTIYSVLYSAEQNGHKNYYYFNLVEIRDAEVFAYVVFTAIPSYANDHMEEWNMIIDSFEWKK